MNDRLKHQFDLDIDQLELRPLSKQQKKNIKRHILAQSKPKKMYYVQHIVAAAVLGVSLVSASSFALPTIAGQVPFIQNVLTYFEDNELPNAYTDFATIVEQVQTSNGVDLMIKDAVYDGTNVMITYAIQTKHALGASPKAEGWVDIKESNGMSGTGSIEKINATTYVGVEKVSLDFKTESPDEIHVQWIPKAMVNTQTNAKIDGNWQFEFALPRLSTTLMPLDQSIKQDGILLTLKSLEQSEMAAVLDFEYEIEETVLNDWPVVSIEMSEAKDNLGNVYEVNGNGGISNDNGTSNDSQTTIYSLNNRATSLTVTPIIHYSKGAKGFHKQVPMSPVLIELN